MMGKIRNGILCLIFAQNDQSGLNTVGSWIPETGNHAKLSGFANWSSNKVPTKNYGIEYSINSIKEKPLSTAESFL